MVTNIEYVNETKLRRLLFRGAVVISLGIEMITVHAINIAYIGTIIFTSIGKCDGLSHKKNASMWSQIKTSKKLNW